MGGISIPKFIIGRKYNLRSFTGRLYFFGSGSTLGTGVSVSSGDFDGDGGKDLLIGAYAGGNVGKVYLIFSSSLGSSSTIYLSSQSDHVFIGENTTEYTGFSVSGSGDVDGDGLDDSL